MFGRGHATWIDVVGHEVDQTPTSVARRGPVRHKAGTTVAMTVVVKTEAAHHHHQPSGELAAAIRHIGAQTMEVVLAQLLERVCVRVHRRVVIAVDGAGDVEEEAAVPIDELAPGRFACPRIARAEEPGQLRLKRLGHTGRSMA